MFFISKTFNAFSILIVIAFITFTLYKNLNSNKNVNSTEVYEEIDKKIFDCLEKTNTNSKKMNCIGENILNKFVNK